jgi:hypothetical protein
MERDDGTHVLTLNTQGRAYMETEALQSMMAGGACVVALQDTGLIRGNINLATREELMRDELSRWCRLQIHEPGASRGSGVSLLLGNQFSTGKQLNVPEAQKDRVAAVRATDADGKEWLIISHYFVSSPNGERKADADAVLDAVLNLVQENGKEVDTVLVMGDVNGVPWEGLQPLGRYGGNRNVKADDLAGRLTSELESLGLEHLAKKMLDPQYLTTEDSATFVSVQNKGKSHIDAIHASRRGPRQFGLVKIVAAPFRCDHRCVVAYLRPGTLKQPVRRTTRKWADPEAGTRDAFREYAEEHASEAYAPEDAESMLMEEVQVVMTKAAEQTLKAIMPQLVQSVPPRSEAILLLRRNLAEAQKRREQNPNAQNREDERKAAALLQLQRHEEFNKEVKGVRKMGLSDKNLAKIARAP